MIDSCTKHGQQYINNDPLFGEYCLKCAEDDRFDYAGGPEISAGKVNLVSKPSDHRGTRMLAPDFDAKAYFESDDWKCRSEESFARAADLPED